MEKKASFGAPLRVNRQLAILLASQSVGMIARAIYFVGLPLFVLERTGSAFSMSISLLLGFAPFTIAGPFAGSIVDRFSRRDLLVATNLLYGFTLLVLPFTHAAWVIYVAAFTASLFGVIIAHSISALIPELVDIAQLAKANSAYAFLRSVNYLLGTFPTFFLIKAMGKDKIFFLSAALLAVSGVSCLVLRRDRVERTAEKPDEDGTKIKFAGFREALRIIWSDRHVRSLTLMHIMFMPVFGAVEVFLPVFCEERLGRADYYTLISASMGVGLALGSLVTYRLLGRVRPLQLVFVSFLGFSVTVLLLTGSGALALAILVCFLMGLADAFGFTTYEYLRQRVVPAAYRGRVFAVMDAMVLLPLPLGYLFMGYAAERVGIGVIGLWLSATALVLTLLSLFLVRGLPELQEQLGG